jgi:hypothetical protein
VLYAAPCTSSAGQKDLDALETEIERLERRDDADYQRWRQRAHERRYAPPSTERLLDVEFVIS